MALDNSTSVLLFVKLDADKFTKFICRQESLVLGINFSFLHQLIKFVDRNDELTFIVDDEKKDQLRIRFNRDKKESEATLKLLDLDETEPMIPNTEFEVIITMSSSDFQKSCRRLKSIGDFVHIKCIDDEVHFSCNGDYSSLVDKYKESEGSISIFYPGKDDEDNKKPFVIEGIYELKNLALFSKCSSLCDDIQLYMKGTHPTCLLAIKYTVATLGKLFVCLSPVIQNTDTDQESDEEDFMEYNKYYNDDVMNNIKYKT